MKKLLMIIGAALSLAAMGDRVVNEDVTLAADAAPIRGDSYTFPCSVVPLGPAVSSDAIAP